LKDLNERLQHEQPSSVIISEACAIIWWRRASVSVAPWRVKFHFALTVSDRTRGENSLPGRWSHSEQYYLIAYWKLI